MGMNPHANGGLLLQPLHLPPFRSFAVDVKTPGRPTTEATRVLGRYLRDVVKCNLESKNFRVFGPDETASNRLDPVLEVTGKTWEATVLPVDEHLRTDVRVSGINYGEDAICF
jgi:xylulose-5-phosphate/fructose-6-phosphate phosphoketolase